jgi:hypothetical protein
MFEFQFKRVSPDMEIFQHRRISFKFISAVGVFESQQCQTSGDSEFVRRVDIFDIANIIDNSHCRVPVGGGKFLLFLPDHRQTVRIAAVGEWGKLDKVKRHIRLTENFSPAVEQCLHS